MTLQIVFVECEIVRSLESASTRLIQVKEEELFSPRWKNMCSKESLNIKNGNVLYINTNGRYRNVYEFMYVCKCNSTNINRFLLKTEQELKNASLREEEMKTTLLREGEVYIPVSGDILKVTSSTFPYVKAYLTQACHILKLWKERNLLESKRSILNINGTILETETSAGNHLIMEKTEGWIFNVSTYIIGLLIDYYQIDGELPEAQLNFSNDAEYRFKVASYLLNVLKTFCVNNGKPNINTVEDVIKGVLEVVKS